MLIRPSGNMPITSPLAAIRIAIFVAAVSIPPRPTGIFTGPQKPPQRRMLAILAGHHPVDLPPRRRLDEKRIDAAAMIAHNHRALAFDERRTIMPPRPP
jgi:hypothetical protein